MGLRFSRFPFALSLGVCLAVSRVMSAAPLPADTDSRTERMVQTVLLRTNEATLLAAYMEFGQRDDRWDDLAQAYLRRCAWWLTDATDRIPDRSIYTDARAIVEAGCDDPIVLVTYAWAAWDAGQLKEGRNVMSRAWPALLESKYDAIWKGRAAYYYSMMEARWSRPDEAEKLLAVAMEQYIKAAQGDSQFADEPSLIIRRIDREFFQKLKFEQQVLFFDHLVAAENIEPWLQRVLLGSFYVSKAWHHRGGEWAHKVKPEAWQLFAENLRLAYAQLVEAHKLHPDRPEAATRLISIAQAGHTPPPETERYWFDQAVRAQFDYTPAYEAMRYSLWPRWGGSHRQMLAFGLECLATGRFDTDVPYEYFNVVRAIAQDLDGDIVRAFEIAQPYDGLQEMIAGYLEDPFNKSSRSYFQTLRVAVAWRCGRFETAREFIDTAEHEFNSHAFWHVGGRMVRALPEVHGRSRDWLAHTEKLDTMVQEGLLVEAITFAGELANESAEAESPAASFYQNTATKLRYTHGLAAGEWVDIQPDKMMHMWEPYHGKWTVDERGGLIGQSSVNGLSIYCEHDFGPNVEIEGTLDFLERMGDYDSAGPFVAGKYRNWQLSTLIMPAQQTVSIRGGWHHVRGDEARVRMKFPVKFRMCWNGTEAGAWIDDKPVVAMVKHEEYDVGPRGQLGVGGYLWFEGVKVRFTGLRVRRIDDPQ